MNAGKPFAKICIGWVLFSVIAFSLPTFTAATQNETIIVTSSADSGPGSLRQALLDAQSGDTISFDPAVFPPAVPVTISITSPIHIITVANLLLDASNAGVILDGSLVPGEWEAGLQITSWGNTVWGLQISNFSGPGIAISSDSRDNVIGGDRSIGSGPFGQGNQLVHNAIGIDLSTPETMLNTITQEVAQITLTVQIKSEADVEAVEQQEPAVSNVQYHHADYDEVLGSGDEGEAQGQQPHQREFPKVGRNDPCPCGSGKKYKHCHGALN